MIVEAMRNVIDGGILSFDEAAAVMEEIMDGSPTEAQFGAFVAALSVRGEDAEEIAGMATVMRRRARAVNALDADLVDTCGTGGDGKNTYNISTAAAFVIAGAGAKVAKHGNRAATSRSGSADVLEELGVKIDLPPETVASCIRAVGMGFMFAPSYHPAMKFAAPLRREIGIRTVFNILGPLTNPAGARRQVLGVGRPELVEKMAGVLARLQTDHALVVHGHEGLDELSITGASTVTEIRDGESRQYQVTPESVGLERSPIEAIGGGDAGENAEIIRSIFAGQAGPRRDVLLLNSAAGLVVAGIADDLSQGVGIAGESIDSGAAAAKLDRLVEATNTY